MKKYYSMLIVALIIVGAIGCNKSSKTTSKEVAAVSDTVSTEFGKFAGSIFNFQSSQDSTIDKQMFLKGLEAALHCDTAKSYMTGMQVGMQLLNEIQNMQHEGLAFDVSTFMREFKKSFNSTDTINEASLQEMQMNFQNLMKRAMAVAKEHDPKVIEIKKAGEAFLQKKAGEGYTKTASGLLYKVIAQGEGANFTDADQIMTKYVGKHVDGKEFDKSEEPVPFSTSGVVPGFAEMLRLMKPGMKVEVIIPANLAYGSDGQRNPMTGDYDILPGEVLVFEVETVGVKPAETAAPSGKK